MKGIFVFANFLFLSARLIWESERIRWRHKSAGKDAREKNFLIGESVQLSAPVLSVSVILILLRCPIMTWNSNQNIASI